MSGSIASYLPSLFAGLTASSSGSVSAGILNAVFGSGTGGSTGIGGGDPVTALQIAQQNQTQDIAAEAKTPSVQMAISQFTAAVQKASSVQQLLANPTVMQVLLTANGLSDQIPYTALATQALTSNLNDPNSLANVISDTRWKPVAQTYQFAAQGLAVIQNPKVIQTIANGYAEVTWRQSLDQTTPGLSEALTFKAEASTITSVDQILGDPILRSVVTTALGIPQQIAFQDLGAQQQAITSRLDISQFKDPNFVNRFTDRYLIAAGQASSSSASATPSLTALAVQAGGLIA
ncbi:MAG: DUF1217 domain-containing protein [Rhodospirillales bacterium]|nr:DUF1217 domain-containing protein [Rhodospirillales bacterium]